MVLLVQYGQIHLWNVRCSILSTPKIMKDPGGREVSVERGSLPGHLAVPLFGVSSSVLLNEPSLTFVLSRHNSRVPLPSLEVLRTFPSLFRTSLILHGMAQCLHMGMLDCSSEYGIYILLYATSSYS